MKSIPTQKRGLQAPERDYVALLEAALKDLGASELTAKLTGLIRARKHARLLEVAAQFSALCIEKSLSYHDAGDIKLARRTYYCGVQLEHLIKKVPFTGGDLHPRDMAWEKFQAAEWRCKRVNARFRYHLMGDFGIGRRSGRSLPYVRFLDEVRCEIRSLIGVEPDFEAIYAKCRYGPGAAVGISGQATHLLKKMDANTVTDGALPYAMDAVWANAQMRECYLPIGPGGYVCHDRAAFEENFYSRTVPVAYNKIDFVPKTAKTDRTIAIEPAMNGFLQLGVDAVLKQRLLRWGIDLADQTKNNSLAQLGSSSDAVDPFSTIDLSAASDSLATNVVKHLLPPDWFRFLNAIRSPCYKLGERVTRYEKFVSMGNGFCFPLETLIFAAVVRVANRVTGSRGYAVYGDDIICRQSTALLVIEHLRYLGFKTNTDKTFLFGPFRESCGTDFFEGENVRPFSLDFLPDCVRSMVKIGNGLLGRHCFLTEAWNVCFMHASSQGILSPYSTTPPDRALVVPLDAFMASKWARWVRSEQRWGYKGFKDTPVLDTRRVPSTPVEEMLCVTAGAASAAYTPRFALRRKTRTRFSRF